MASRSRGHASFMTQVNALLRKDLTFQKRNMGTNIRLILFPAVILILIKLLQHMLDKILENPTPPSCNASANPLIMDPLCPIRRPQPWPPLIHIPDSDFRAVKTDGFAYEDLPDDSCRKNRSCPVSMFFTGANYTLGEGLASFMFPDTNVTMVNSTYDPSKSSGEVFMGTEQLPSVPNYKDPAFLSSTFPLYALQRNCTDFSGRYKGAKGNIRLTCLEVHQLWRNSSSEVNDELYKGYRKGNPHEKINEIAAGYDLLNTNIEVFNVSIWYNSTYLATEETKPMLRIPALVNLMSNAFLQYFGRRPDAKIYLEYIKEMPKGQTSMGLKLDVASLAGTLFFTWIILLLFPVILASLVYEKEHQLRIMMKMHGLGDGAYWIISYSYFLIISTLFMILFVGFGSILGLKFFSANSYGVQAAFYFAYINVQIAGAYLVACFFSNARTATVVAYVGVFAAGFVADFLFIRLANDQNFPRGWIIVLELVPAFSLFRGLSELGQAVTFSGGMRWKDLSHDNLNPMSELLMLMFLEWIGLLAVAFCLDQYVTGNGSCFSFMRNFQKKAPSSDETFNVLVQIEKHDVIQEREKVEQLLRQPDPNYSIVCDEINKMYPGTDGNPDTYAVKGLSLALAKGQCFGMIGPNGAGKTSFINMMVGMTKPTSGTAFVEGLNIETDMSTIYTSMGVCPQFDLLWGNLTGREHLLFYARLKNLQEPELTEAVEESLKSVNLFKGGVADRQAKKYSGGMKRRLSVAISLIGDPKVVYLDEPSTGLDPASRKNLWNVMKRAKKGRAIFLTTHSMEEAEVLCDRLGIFVSGSLQCIGHPRELKTRYGGFYVLTMNTAAEQEDEVEKMVRDVCPNATKGYGLSGTQKFEMSKEGVKIADVFRVVEKAKKKFEVAAWGLSDTTLEDVVNKVCHPE